MNTCTDIRQSIVVNVSLDAANAEWTAFTLWNIYYRTLEDPDENGAEHDSGLVRMQYVDDTTTRVTVDLDYCPHRQGMSGSDEIALAQQHLRGTLAHYKGFVESSSFARA